MIAGDDTTGRGEAFEEARAALVGRLRARQGEIERVIFARISDEQFDLTGSENAEYVAGLRAAIVAALDHVLTGIEHGVKESTESVPAAAIEQARRAARLGVGLDTVLRRYVAGYSQLEGFIMGEVERDRSLGTVMLRDVLGRAGMLVEGLISAVSDAYQREVERSDRTAPPGGSTVVSRGGPASSSRAARKGARQGRAATAGARRQRIVEAVVEVVAERGSTGASVGLVIERARVSRRTFYEVFPGGIEDGLNAVMDWVLERSVTLVSQRLEQAGSWQDGVREALAALLLFFDSDPALARVCFVETLGGGTAVVEHRERNLRALRSLIVARIESEDVRVQPLAAESVMASVMGVIYNRLLNREPGPLIELLGPLMGTAVTPFVSSERMALEEELRGDELARAIQTDAPDWVRSSISPAEIDVSGKPAGELALPATLANPSARRARECLVYLAGRPGASNIEIAVGIGVAHRSQISKLLSELADDGLVSRHSEGQGKRNAWYLTPRGADIARLL